MRVVLRGGESGGQKIEIEGKAKYLQIPVPYYPPDGWKTRERWHPEWTNMTVLEMQDPETGEWLEYRRFTAETFEATGETQDGAPVWRLCKSEADGMPPSGRALAAVWA